MKEVVLVIVGLGRMLLRQRAWWMIPILLALALVAVLVLVATVAPAAPFLYPLF